MQMPEGCCSINVRPTPPSGLPAQATTTTPEWWCAQGGEGGGGGGVGCLRGQCLAIRTVLQPAYCQPVCMGGLHRYCGQQQNWAVVLDVVLVGCTTCWQF
jgi:hypothetical protein